MGFFVLVIATGCVSNKEFILMITQFVNQIEHHPESVFVHADTMARMKRDTLSGITGRFRSIRAFLSRVSPGHTQTRRNLRTQCRDMERSGQTT